MATGNTPKVAYLNAQKQTLNVIVQLRDQGGNIGFFWESFFDISHAGRGHTPESKADKLVLLRDTVASLVEAAGGAVDEKNTVDPYSADCKPGDPGPIPDADND